MKSKLAEVIQKAIDDCRINGSSTIKIDEDKSISVEWEVYDGDKNYDIMCIYFYDDGRIVFWYQDINTKVKNEM